VIPVTSSINSVADPVPHGAAHFGKPDPGSLQSENPDPDPQQSQNRIRIHNEVKIQELWRLTMETCRATIEAGGSKWSR
jgi:hypothetical protein